MPDDKTGLKNRPILVVVAVRQELGPLQEKGCLNGQAQCLITGMGPRVREIVRKKLSSNGFRLVVSAGFAGGTRPGFQVGDLVMASEVVDAPSGLRWKPDPRLFGLNGLASVGRFVTVPRLLRDTNSKAEIGSRFGGIAVDMETASVAEAAVESGVPWVGLRSILDPMESEVSIGSLWQGVRALLSGRRRIDLSNFMTAMRSASQSLAGGLQRLIRQPT